MNWLHALNNDWIKSTAALVIGWGLSSLTPYFGERRKALSRVLTDLLRIRWEFVVFKKTAEEFNKVSLLPPAAQAYVRNICLAGMAAAPESEELKRRYNESLSLLACVDPVLAYKLPSSDEFVKVFQNINESIVKLGTSEELWTTLNLYWFTRFDSDMKDTIRCVAKKGSLLTRKKIESVLVDEQGPPSYVLDVIHRELHSKITEVVKKASAKTSQ